MARRRASIIVAGVGVPVVAAVVYSRMLTDLLWFREVGQADVYWRILTLKLELLFGVGGVAAAFFLATSGIAARRARSTVRADPRNRGRSPPVHGLRASVVACAASCLVLGFAVGLHAMHQWQTVVLWSHRSQFGVLDPIHHRDVSFFVFTLPLLQTSTNIALAVVAIAGALAAVIYVICGVLSLRPLRATAAARAHLAALTALALVVLALRIYLISYSLEISRAPSRGQQFPGADYVDARVRIPGVQLLALLTLICACAVVAGQWFATRGHGRAGARLGAGALLGTTAVALVLLLPISWVVQEFVVYPQPLAAERTQLRGAIDSTRLAFSLNDVEVSQAAPTTRISASDVARHSELLENVPVWDSSVVIERMRQLASGTPYFRARSPTLDVERVNGKDGLTVFAAQELDLREVSDRAQGWQNSRLVYTHGLGSLRYSASLIGANGQPELQPPESLSRPRIYFGQLPPDAPAWVVVNTHRSEVDRPIPAQKPQGTYHYNGSGGIALSSWVRRAAFAIRLGDPTLLLSRDITSRSRIVLERDVIGRLRKLAGFLRWDPNVTTVEVGSRVTFIANGYTTSSNYPQAEPVSLAGGAVNYARASVRATVDAFSGETHLYISDDGDPIARAWRAAFPGLLRPVSDFPDKLRTHLHYPQALFDAQSELYQRFHAGSPSAFASRADDWGYPTSLSGSIGATGNIRFDPINEQDQLQPADRFAVPPGSDGPNRLLRTALYSPQRGENVVAELDGWVDDSARARLSLVAFTGDRVISGPSQISRLVFTTPRISDALQVINKETTDVNKHSLTSVAIGAPHWLRFAGGIVQVQPIYSEGSTSGVTRMLGVTVFINGRAGIGGTLPAAVGQAMSPR